MVAQSREGCAGCGRLHGASGDRMARIRTRTLVGLDIEPTYLAAAEVVVNGGIAVRRAVLRPLEPGIMRDGEVTDREGLAEALRKLFREHKLPKRVRLGVANQRIVVRTIDLPPLAEGKELDTALRFHAQDHVPMPLEQAVLDYRSLGIVPTPDGQRTRVVLVAARRGMALDHARGWLSHVGLETPVQSVDGDPEIVEAARAVLDEGLHRLLDGVRNSLDFYGTQPDAPGVSQLVLTGPGLTVPGLAEALGEALAVPVRAGTVAQAEEGAVAPGAEPCVAVAAGLAVEEAPE